jgi:hypothetical protein
MLGAADSLTREAGTLREEVAHFISDVRPPDNDRLNRDIIAILDDTQEYNDGSDAERHDLVMEDQEPVEVPVEWVASSRLLPNLLSRRRLRSDSAKQKQKNKTKANT